MAKLIVRVPVATYDCISFSPANEYLVIASRRTDVAASEGEHVEIPGFHGTVRPVLPELNRGVLLLVTPSDTDAKYLVAWDGDTERGLDATISDLFVPH